MIKKIFFYKKPLKNLIIFINMNPIKLNIENIFLTKQQ